MTQLPLQEFGFAAGVTGALLVLFLWWVRGAREDTRASAKRVIQVSDDFTSHLKGAAEEQTKTLTRNTEVLVSVANVLERTQHTSVEHEERARHRHEEVLRAILHREDHDKS